MYEWRGSADCALRLLVDTVAQEVGMNGMGGLERPKRAKQDRITYLIAVASAPRLLESNNAIICLIQTIKR